MSLSPGCRASCLKSLLLSALPHKLWLLEVLSVPLLLNALSPHHREPSCKLLLLTATPKALKAKYPALILAARCPSLSPCSLGP